MSELLKLTALTKRYGDVLALDNVDLTVESGKIIGLLGPNGSGKTTLIKLLNGLLTPTEGTVLVNGSPVGPETKKIVSYLPDNSFLPPWMTARQIVELFSDFYADFRPELALQMIDRLGVPRDMRLKNLSKGGKEKVCLILIMSRNALLYVLDEPIAAVDPATRDFVISTIINNHNPDSSVLISTHLISDIEPVLDEAIFINHGRIALHQSVEEIRKEKGKSVDALFREVFKW